MMDMEPGVHLHHHDVLDGERVFNAWTVPRTWVTSEVVTSTIMNTHIRDQLLAGGGPVAATLAALNSAYGTPSDGSRGVIVANSCLVGLTYSTAIGKWVSDEYPLSGGTVSGSSNSYYGPGAYGDANARSGLSWDPVNSGGLTFQVKCGGYINGSGNNVTCTAGVDLLWIVSGGTSSSSIQVGSGQENATTYIFMDWTNVTNPGAYKIVNVGIYVHPNMNAGFRNAAVTGRFVG